MNGADEAAVAAFLAGEIDFPTVVASVAAVLAHHPFESDPTLADLMRVDAWSRDEVTSACRR